MTRKSEVPPSSVCCTPSTLIETPAVFPTRTQTLRLPVITSCLVISALLLVYFWPRRNFALYYVSMAALLAAVALLPLFDLIPADRYLPTGALALGVVLVVGGIFDHALLTRTMGAHPQEGASGAV